MTTSKRHYRVVQRDKELNHENVSICKNHIKQFALLGTVVYCISVVLSVSVGYLVGNNR